ncbi:MAG TPA: hypothetical protein VK760_03470 [Candidatus Acidoferrales bacterium]|jgi:hypothetical protein|nr:hypothetical protein [Candidatus Acidoferrales bacterium]
MESYPVPAYVISIDSWHVRSSGKDYVYRWRYATRTADGIMNATRYPIGGSGLPANANIGPEILGPFAWTLRPALEAAHQPQPAANADLPNMKVIASVVAYRPDYAIDMVGVESIAGHPSYHLRLRPYGDAVKHKLRDLWVDEQTFDLWKARYYGQCGPCSAPNTITVTFQPAAGAWIVIDESFISRCSLERTDNCRFDLSTDDVAFISGMPDWLFDRDAYRQHAKAREQDYLAGLLTEPH